MNWILSVDTAANSGWCITDSHGRYFASGECAAFGPGPVDACKLVLSHDPKAKLLLEKPSHGNRSQLVGMGAARGAWLAAWNTALGIKTRVKDVFPVTWRSKLFGDTSQNHTRERLAAQVFSKKSDLPGDEAAAICIAAYATMKAGSK